MTRFRFQCSFVVFALLLQGCYRLWLFVDRRADLADLSGADTLSMFLVGFHLDTVVAAGLTVLTCLVLLLMPGRWLRGTLVATRFWAGLVFLLLSFAGLAGLQFFSFYDFQPNYLVLDHAADKEVMRTVLAAFPVFRVAAGALLLAAAMSWLLCRLVRIPQPVPGWAWRDRLALLGLLLLTAVAARGTLDHRALNPSAAAFSSNRLANEIAGSGLYNVVYEAVQRSKGKYGAVADCLEPLPRGEALAAARQYLAGSGDFVVDEANPLVRTIRSPERASHPRNVIFVVLESFTGRLIGHLGGELELSPQLDALAAEGLALTRCYATGERTIQGLEASLCSFPPLPGVAAIRRPQGRVGFETIASVLRRQGFATSFVYGGQGIFDHMRGFFLTNGYQRFVEENDFEDPEFTGSWGVCDDDLYRRVVREAGEFHAAGKPFLVTALTVSLHSPWQYPERKFDKVDEDIDPPGGFEREELNTFLYADSAIGELMRRSRSEPWFDETLFVFVGDHGVHLRGKLTVPVEEYRVPAVFYCPRYVEPRRLESVTSQIDLTPTVLGLLGLEYRSTFLGRDLLASATADSLAIMIYRKKRYGLVSGSRLSLLKHGDRIETRCWDGAENDWLECEATAAHAEDQRVGAGMVQMAEELLEEAAYRVAGRAGR